MQRHRLGTTDLEFSELGLGCWAFAGGPNWGRQEESDSVAAVRCALDVGINWFDTAEGYGGGLSEEVLGRALKGESREALVATKVSWPHLKAADLIKSCESSLRRLQREVIDYYQVHWPNPEVPMGETVGALQELLEAGKIRAYGACNFGPVQLREYLAAGGTPSADQVAYNLLSRAIEFEIMPALKEAGMGLLCYSPLMQGLLTGKFSSLDAVPEDRQRTRHYSSISRDARHGEAGFEEDVGQCLAQLGEIAQSAGRPLAELALRWLLDRKPGAVTSVIVGARDARQMERNARAAGEPLSPELIDALDRASSDLKAAMGPNADLWESPGRIR